MNFIKLLESLSDETGWHEINGPDSRVGVDYWFRAESEAEANINIDQNCLTVTIDGETVYSDDDYNDGEDDPLEDYLD